MPGNAVAKQQLFVEFVASDLCQIVSARVEEHRHDKALRALHGKRFARTDLFIQLQQTFLIIGRRILGKRRHDLRLLAEQLQDLRIGADAKRAHQYSNGNLSRSVHTHVENVIGVCLVFQPCTAVRNHCTGKQSFSDLIMSDSIVDTW